MKTVVIVPPAQEPVGLDRIKNHARQMSNVHDGLLQDLISASRSITEQALGIAIIEQQLTQYRDRFDHTMRLPRPPLISVQSITYLDADGQSQTVDQAVYHVDNYKRPGQITLNPSQTWPMTYHEPNSVQINFTAGYGPDRNDVPESLKQGLITLAINQYYHPGGVEEGLVQRMFHAYFAEQFNWLVDEV